MTDKRILWIMGCTLISNSSYALIAPFLPLEFAQKGVEARYIGLIFSIYSVAVIICSPLVGMIIPHIGTTNLIALGTASMGVCFMLFSLIDGLETVWLIMLYSMVLRFAQGASSAFIQTTCYSIATNDFPSKKSCIVGWVEAMTGLGLIIGPLMGSALYQFFGFADTFTANGIFMLLLAVLIKVKFPTSGFVAPKEEPLLDHNLNAEDPESLETQGKVTVMDLLRMPRFTLAALSSSLCYFTYSFQEPILAPRLVDFNLTSLQIGWFFAIWPMFYIPASIMVQYVPRKVEYRVTIILAAFCLAVAFLLAGPSAALNFPNSLKIMCAGQALVGVFTAIMMIPGLPEMVESTLPHFKGRETQVNNLSSGIFNAFLGFGQVLAPPFGSFSVQAVGFQWTTDIVAMVCLLFGLVYLFLGDGIEAFKTTFSRLRDNSEEKHAVSLNEVNNFNSKTSLTEADDSQSNIKDNSNSTEMQTTDSQPQTGVRTLEGLAVRSNSEPLMTTVSEKTEDFQRVH